MAHLKSLIGVPQYMAVGILEALWHFTATQAPRGDIGRWSDDQIASAIGWEGTSDYLITALVESRWIDKSEEFRLLVHDWVDHSDQTVKRCPLVRTYGFASDSLVNDESATSDELDSLPPASCLLPPEPVDTTAPDESSFDIPPEADYSKLNHLLNRAKPLEGTPAIKADERLAWLMAEGPVMEADVAAGKFTWPQIVRKYFNQYLKSERAYCGIAQREAERKQIELLQAAEDAEPDSPTVSMDRLVGSHG